MGFRRAFTLFVTFLLAVYFIIGLPVFGYYVYFKKSNGLPLAIASTLYPFPVATVGGEVILLKPYYDRLTYIQTFNSRTQQTVPSGEQLRQQVITKLIDEAVTRTWANKEGITVSSDDIDSAYNKIVQDKGSETDVQTVLSQLYDLSDTEFKRLIPDLLYQEKVETTLLERVHVKHILVSSQQDADKVKSEVTAENFNEKAKQYSEDKATRDNGGDLGFFDHEGAKKLDPELEKAFFAMKAGDISSPVKSAYGYHIVHVVDRTGTTPLSFSAWLAEKRTNTKIYRFLK